MTALRDDRSGPDANTIINLVVRYPYMFSQPQSRFEFHRGWLPAVSNVCMEIDDILGADKRGFHWRQIKEKLGSLRLYYDFSSSKQDQLRPAMSDESLIESSDRACLRATISEVVSRACKASAMTCIACCRSAALSWIDGYCATTCELHRSVLNADSEAFWRLNEFGNETTAKALVERTLQRRTPFQSGIALGKGHCRATSNESWR